MSLAAIVAAVAVVFWFQSRAAADQSNTPPNIVMVVIDTLRADHLGCYGYDHDTSPNIDALAEQSVLFERCYSTSSWTLPAAASLLSGTYPSRHGARTWTGRVRDDVPWLVSRLQEAGYHTMGVSSNPFITADHGFDRGFDVFDSDTVLAAAQWSFPLLDSQYKAMVLASTSATATRRAMQMLGEVPEDEPFFLLVHYMDPHADYAPPEPFADKFDPDYQGAITGHVQSENIDTDISGRDLEHITALYDGEIAHVDKHVGQLLIYLQALGVRRKTAVILTADHGEELLDHGQWFHGHTLYEEVVRVPLIVDWPGIKDSGRSVATPVSLVDVTPTLLDLIGQDVPSGVQGRSLTGALSGEAIEPRPLLMETRLSGRLKAVVTGWDKVIAEVQPGGDEPVLLAVEHFDLQADAVEQQPNSSKLDAKSRLTEVLRDLIERYRPSEEVSRRADLEQQQLQRLRGLGYVGGGTQDAGGKP